MTSNFIKYFVRGLAFVLPFALTAYVIYSIIDWLGNYLHIQSDFIVLFVFIVVITIIGFLLPYVLGNIVWLRFESILKKVPLLGAVYKTVKDITTAVVGTESKFTNPVMVEMHLGPIYKIGFVTNEDIPKLLGKRPPNASSDEKFVLVYFPISFSIAGDLFMVPLSKVTPIDMKATDVMQTMLSAGLIGVKQEEVK